MIHMRKVYIKSVKEGDIIKIDFLRNEYIIIVIERLKANKFFVSVVGRILKSTHNFFMDEYARLSLCSDSSVMRYKDSSELFLDLI